MKLSPLYFEVADVNTALKCSWSKPRGGGHFSKENGGSRVETTTSRETMVFQGMCYGNLWHCVYVPASPGCYSLPFHFLQQLITSAAETLWKSWVQSAESGRRHSQHRKTQLECIMVCICICWRCCAVEKCKSCTYAPLNLPVLRAALMQRLYGSCFLRAWKCWGLQEQCRGKNKMSRNSSALGQVRRSCEGGRESAFQYVGYGPLLFFY